MELNGNDTKRNNVHLDFIKPDFIKPSKDKPGKLTVWLCVPKSFSDSGIACIDVLPRDLKKVQYGKQDRYSLVLYTYKHGRDSGILNYIPCSVKRDGKIIKERISPEEVRRLYIESLPAHLKSKFI